jgi:hypothetical protein
MHDPIRVFRWSLGFFPIGKFKKFKRGWRKKVPWQPAQRGTGSWLNNAKYSAERDDVDWAPSEQVKNAIKLVMKSQAATWLKLSTATRRPTVPAPPPHISPVSGRMVCAPRAMPEVAKRRG